MLRNLKTTKCFKCGKEINGSNLKPPFLDPCTLEINLTNFYGNRVKKFMRAVCGCEQEYIAYLAPVNNGYKILDIAVKEDDSGCELSNAPIRQENAELEINLDAFSRQGLIREAKRLNIAGSLVTMKSDELKALIKEKLGIT